MRLFALLLLLGLGRAAEPPRTFAGGADVFGRLPPCRACHALLSNLDSTLLPRLRAQLHRDAVRRQGSSPAARRVDFGAYEALIQEELPKGCMFSSTYHDKLVRDACGALVESREEELSEAFHRWVRLQQEPGTHTPAWSWNRELCHVASDSCPLSLAQRPLSDFADDGSGAEDRRLRSERPPPDGTTREGLLPLVAANFVESVMGEGDVLVYISYASRHAAAHQAVWPSLVSACAILATATPSLRVAVLDAEANDVPPPHDAGTRAPTMVMYAAGEKSTPRYAQHFQDGRLTLFDVLTFVAQTAGSEEVARGAAQSLMDPDRQAQLFSRPWEEAEEAWEEEPAWVSQRRRSADEL